MGTGWQNDLGNNLNRAITTTPTSLPLFSYFVHSLMMTIAILNISQSWYNISKNDNGNCIPTLSQVNNTLSVNI